MAEPQQEAMYAGKAGWGKKWGLVTLAVAAIIGLVVASRFLGWGGHLLEWLNLAVRWFHVILGIAWIGASFYFIWLENNLEREDVPDNLAGRVYSVHGGGFYYVEKYKVAPPSLPETLHWFQWEAYLTWLSGFCLLVIVYYANAEVTMVDPSGLALPAYGAISLGLATLAVGWLVYDLMCKTPLVEYKALFSAVAFALIVLLAWLLTLFLSSRAAYMHVGAMLGTLMAFNVFFVIIPAHRIMVQAVREGTALDPKYGKAALLRSVHNNYMTLPVVFIMISNHFPSTFGNLYNWAILAGLFLASAGIRHYLNLHERGQQARWILPAASLLVLTLALVTAPVARGLPEPGEPAVAFDEVEQIIQARCTACHAAVPTDNAFAAPPKGIVFDTPGHIVQQADLIYRNAVLSEYMPLGNKTGMLESERELLGRWYLLGATTD